MKNGPTISATGLLNTIPSLILGAKEGGFAIGWYEALKDVLTIVDKFRDAGLKQKLAIVQVEAAHLAEENARLR
jgi:hypothetical protein